MTSNIDIFDDLETSDVSEDTQNDTTTDENAENAENAETQENDSPVPVVATIPDGAMSVTDFAAFMTQTLMRQAIESGQDLDGSQYVVPQAVYQTVKAQRDRIPHVIVKGSEDSEGRVYILKDEATAWWQNRKERLSTRGSGTARASSRTPEDNLTLLGEAVRKNLYALSRLEMWNGKLTQTETLVTKYKNFLGEQSVSEETIALTVQEATDQFNAEQAAKAAEKEASKKSKNATEDSDGE